MVPRSNELAPIDSSTCSSGASFDDDEDASTSSSTSLDSHDETLVAESSVRARLVHRAFSGLASTTSATDEMSPPQTGVMQQRAQQVRESADESRAQVSANKQYKNSPFGLTNHYLTLPESGSAEPSATSTIAYNSNSGKDRHKPTNQEDNYLESDDDDEDIEGAQQRQEEGTFRVSGRRHDNKADASATSDTSDEISDGIPSLASNEAVDWREMRRQTKLAHRDRRHRTSSGAKQLDRSESQTRARAQTSQPHRLGPRIESPTGKHVPVSDVGLDAKLCNAKHSATMSSHSNQFCVDDDCYLSSSCASADSRARRKPAMTGKGSPDAETQIASDGTLLPKSACDSLLVKFSSIMYATFLVILGCILHVSELRQKSRNSSDHIYTIVVALIGILWLLFLQSDLQRYKRYASKYIFIESLFRGGGSHLNAAEAYKRRHIPSAAHQKAAAAAAAADTGAAADPSARSTSSSTASLVNDRLSVNTEVIFKKTAYKMYQQRAAIDRLNLRGMAPSHRYNRHKPAVAVSEPNSQQPNLHRSSPSMTFAPKHLSSSSSLSGSLAALNKPHQKSKDSLVPAYKFLHGKMGANFYLKCGMAAFCFGHVIHEGLRFGQQLYFFGTGNVNCRDSAALVAHLITPLYSFYQLFMMFKYSNLVINRHKVLARFGLMHIIGTSVTFWFRTILEEAFEDFVHKMDYFKTNKLHQFNSTHETLIHPNLAAFFVSVASPVKSLNSDPLLGDSTTSIANLNATDSLNATSLNRNLTLAQSLVALMSSPLSATITPQIVRHIPDSYACAQNTLLTTKSMNALPYLYPFTIEYNLLLAATFLSLYFNVGKVGPYGVGVVCRPALSNQSRYYSRSSPQSPPSKSPQVSSVHLSASHFDSSDNDRPNMFVDWMENDASQGRGDEKDLGEYKSNFVVNADCHSANKGLFCGFFVLLVTLVTIVIFFVTINKPTHIQLGIKINLIQETTLTTLILVVTLVAFRQIVKLNRNTHLKDKVTTDDVLMLIPLPFFFIHSLLSFRAETASIYSFNPMNLSNIGETLASGETTSSASSASPLTLQTSVLVPAVPTVLQRTLSSGGTSSNNSIFNGGLRNSTIRNLAVPLIDTNPSDINNSSSHIDHFKLITVALNIIVMIEVLVQTNFIIDGLRRCSESRYMRFKKPGRELITFAILLNITYWIVATFETKSVEQYKTEIEYYGPLPYMFISHTTLPVMLFYRYHSSVCLAEIWNRAYKPPKKG